MQGGLITLPDAAEAPVAFAANRNTIDRLPDDDAVLLKFKHPAISNAGHSLPPVARGQMIFEVR